MFGDRSDSCDGIYVVPAEDIQEPTFNRGVDAFILQRVIDLELKAAFVAERGENSQGFSRDKCTRLNDLRFYQEPSKRIEDGDAFERIHHAAQVIWQILVRRAGQVSSQPTRYNDEVRSRQSAPTRDGIEVGKVW